LHNFFQAFFRRHDVQIGVIIVIMGILFSVLSPGFLTLGNMMDLLESYSVSAIMAAGLLVVLISGGIDISFAAIAGVTQFLVATILVNFGGNWFAAFALAGLFGALLGVVNALLIHYLRAISVIVTISTMTFFFSMLMFVTQGRSIYNLPDWFTSNVSLFSIPFPVTVAAIALLVTLFLLSRLTIGRLIYGLGGNTEAAKRMGCSVAGLRCFVYGYSGFMGAVAGIVQAHRVEEVVPNALMGRELDVLAAVVLGGASLSGGIGTVSGTILGIVLLAMLQNGLTLIGVSSYSFGLVTGLVILASVSATAYAAKLQQKGSVRHAI
jgi:simple sugar transport system permease protein